jgi:hypothetical protein
MVFRDRVDMVYRYSNILCFNSRLLPCPTDVQWEKMLSRILRNHLGSLAGNRRHSWDGPSRGKDACATRHAFNSQAFPLTVCCFAPSCQRSTFSKSCSRDSMSLQYYHHLSCKSCAHRFAFPSLSAIVFSCAYLSCHAGFNGTRWKITRDMLMTCGRCCPRL